MKLTEKFVFITENKDTLFESKPETNPFFLHKNVNTLKKSIQNKEELHDLQTLEN